MSESIHLHGHPFSQPSRSVEFFLRASGINFEFHLVDLIQKQHLTEEYSKINPNQSVPALVHGDFNVWESAAIVTYLADALNLDNQWYPKDFRIRARINAYLHWHHQSIREPIGGYLFFKVIGPKFFGLPEASEETIAAAKAKYNECFATIKWILSETGYIGRTAEATIADIFAYSEIAEAILVGEDLSDYPEVKAWYEKIGNNEAVTQVHQFFRQFVASSAAPPADAPPANA